MKALIRSCGTGGMVDARGSGLRAEGAGGVADRAAGCYAGALEVDKMTLPDAPQLFVDYQRIANAHPSGRRKRMRGVERVFHPAVHHPHPVLVPEAPWERSGFTTSTVGCSPAATRAAGSAVRQRRRS